MLFFDNASTTRSCEAAVDALSRFSAVDYGNPSSTHALGRVAAQALDEARAFFADVFSIEPAQIVFTGSGTEADNLAVLGASLGMGLPQSAETRGRVILSAIEHPAVTESAHSLRDFGFEVIECPVNRQGQPVLDEFRKALTPQTVLVSIQQVNNITGALLPVEELARITKAAVPTAIFHTDAIQGFGRIPCPDSRTSVDLVSISAHKIHGPKGIGLLAVLNRRLLKKGLRPLIFGGGQEQGLRSGTQSVALAAAFQAAAAELLRQRLERYQHAALLRTRLIEALSPHADLSLQWNSPLDTALAVPHILNLSIPGCPSGPMARLIEEAGCIVSTGSACQANRDEPDPVLDRMGFPPEIARSAIRISFSHENTIADIQTLGAAIQQAAQRIFLLHGRRGKFPRK